MQPEPSVTQQEFAVLTPETLNKLEEKKNGIRNKLNDFIFTLNGYVKSGVESATALRNARDDLNLAWIGFGFLIVLCGACTVSAILTSNTTLLIAFIVIAVVGAGLAGAVWKWPVRWCKHNHSNCIDEMNKLLRGIKIFKEVNSFECDESWLPNTLDSSSEELKKQLEKELNAQSEKYNRLIALYT